MRIIRDEAFCRKAREKYEETGSITAVAEELKCNPSTVRRALIEGPRVPKLLQHIGKDRPK